MLSVIVILNVVMMSVVAPLLQLCHSIWLTDSGIVSANSIYQSQDPYFNARAEYKVSLWLTKNGLIKKAFD
jgi:hypothetical protein